VADLGVRYRADRRNWHLGGSIEKALQDQRELMAFMRAD